MGGRDAAASPVAAPAATGVALVWAVALIASGTVAARDVLLSTGVITGSPWFTQALNWLDGLTAQTLMMPAGIATAGLGGATAKGSGRKITLTIAPLAGYDTATLKLVAHTAATEAVAPLARPPSIRIRMKEQVLP